MKTHADRPTRTAQRRPAADAGSHRRATAGAADAHARESAQRERIDAAFGPAAQRQGEEEEELQSPAAPLQRQEEEELLQGRFAQRVEDEEEPVQGRFDGGAPAPNRTGMPDALKNGVESLSGLDLSDVRVHANSAAPERLDALAYAQGNDIHLAPGQQQHLPHEAWHVVQQRQGRVAPTMQLAGVPINDDAALEAEADAMGQTALQSAGRERR